MRLTRLTLICIALILALGFYRLCTQLLAGLEAQTFQATEELMVDTSEILAASISSKLQSSEIPPDIVSSFQSTFQLAENRAIKAKIFSKAKTDVSLHCYLSNNQGIVIFDSQEKRTGQNLSQFHDIYRTMRGKYGSRSTRISDEDSSSSVMYVGAPITFQGEKIGVLTVYKPQAELLPFVRERRSQILRPAITIAIAILLLIAAVLFWLYRPIGTLANYARRITAGERPPYPSLGKGREVNALGSALLEMRESLEGRAYIENYTQTLTHEMKSPLAAIRGAAELLDESEMPVADRTHFLQNIRQEVERSERLINRLLHLSELEGQTELRKREPVSLSQVIADAKERLRPLAEHREVTLTTGKWDDSEEPTIEGDYYILRAAFENLLQNAVEFSPRGEMIEVRLQKENNQWRIEVIDQGPGIPDYALHQVFDRFYSHRPKQESSRPGTQPKGSGLGLSFVREAAHLHGGSVQVVNRDQGGLKAILILPKLE